MKHFVIYIEIDSKMEEKWNKKFQPNLLVALFRSLKEARSYPLYLEETVETIRFHKMKPEELYLFSSHRFDIPLALQLVVIDPDGTESYDDCFIESGSTFLDVWHTLQSHVGRSVGKEANRVTVGSVTPGRYLQPRIEFNFVPVPPHKDVSVYDSVPIPNTLDEWRNLSLPLNIRRFKQLRSGKVHDVTIAEGMLLFLQCPSDGFVNFMLNPPIESKHIISYTISDKYTSTTTEYQASVAVSLGDTFADAFLRLYAQLDNITKKEIRKYTPSMPTEEEKEKEETEISDPRFTTVYLRK
jgi:hypothetical protein